MLTASSTWPSLYGRLYDDRTSENMLAVRALGRVSRIARIGFTRIDYSLYCRASARANRKTRGSVTIELLCITH